MSDEKSEMWKCLGDVGRQIDYMVPQSTLGGEWQGHF